MINWLIHPTAASPCTSWTLTSVFCLSNSFALIVISRRTSQTLLNVTPAEYYLNKGYEKNSSTIRATNVHLLSYRNSWRCNFKHLVTLIRKTNVKYFIFISKEWNTPHFSTQHIPLLKKLLRQDYDIIWTHFQLFIGIPPNSLENK